MQRKAWVDCCKFLAMYMVVLGHFSPQIDWLHIYIYIYHVPLFFIISGFLQSSRHNMSIYTENINTIKTLLVPYLLFSFIGFISESVILYYQQDTISFTWRSLVSLFISISTDAPPSRISPLWFVYCLFWVKIINALIHRIPNSKTIFGIKLLFGLVALLTTMKIFIIPRLIVWILVALPFYWLGLYIKRWERLNEYKANTYTLWICICISVLLPVLASIINGRSDFYFCEYGNSPILFFLFGAITSITVMMVFKSFCNRNNSIITVISKGTLLIVAFHRFLLWPFENFNNMTLVRLIVPFIVVLTFYYPIIIILDKAPFLLGKHKDIKI